MEENCLIAVNKTLDEVQKWIAERMNKDQKIGQASGKLRNFIIEPFVPHKEEEETYVCIYSHRHADSILFYHQGGVDIGDVDSKAVKLDVPVGEALKEEDVLNVLLAQVKAAKKSSISKFIINLYQLYVDLYFTYLEINPLVVTDEAIFILDLAAKLDATADFMCRPKWGEIDYPPPFGRDAYPEEAYIADLDSKSGASLKLTILNRKGRIWTMVAGGGASVIYSDTICDLGGTSELANYGEYSGAPSEQQTYEYAKTILSLITHEPHPQGKVLIIGGGIANFTNVAATFRGIITAFIEFKDRMIEHNIKIFVRRAGPNYQEGLRRMREVGQSLGIPLYVFGPETHMTAICGMALGTKPIPQENNVEFATANFLLPSGDKQPIKKKPEEVEAAARETAIQVAAAHAAARKSKFYWGHKEILISVYKKMNDAMTKHPDADVLISFASLRSAYQSTVETLEFPQIRTVAIIAEGIPENMTRKLIKLADEKGVIIIGPATVGGLKPGCFKIGNTGGMMDNILHSKLYRPGSVAYVSKSGGMSNELNNIVSHTTDGVYEGVAIGGDRYPGTTFIDHIIRYQADDNVKMIILLGEVGGTEEYKVCDALKKGQLTKPLVAWCIGDVIRSVFNDLVKQGVVVPAPEVPPPTVPMDYSWARELGLIRKPASFMTSICDERGQELIYAGNNNTFLVGMPISEVLQKNVGIGGVISLLWFQRCLPPYVCKFFEMCLMVTADHGPAVSGAHNTIVCARAGKDLVSSLVSGLLTIGDRFGGALDSAARQFSEAYDKVGMHPAEFVNHMRNKGELIMGIGHRVKSINNPDQRVSILKDYVLANFPATPLLLYALEVEKLTTSKKPNLILNVDGCIATCFVDMLRNCGSFTSEEAQEYINIGAINSLFVLGRTIGFVGHFMDQKRLKQGLYRHPWDDISYVLPEQYNN
ncbi:hypothetical protein D910_11845 [Dendroctonus ponderosae]|uniref:ATP citrate synthase n=1 Tax=Dendroctonus ponderosae TaxID=77166 RepID=U4UPY7_DENPD|nr:hypothetical protein D910_11845 [Dendroctonus ponderosae]